MSTRHAPRARFERIMRERVIAAHVARPWDVERVTLAGARWSAHPLASQSRATRWQRLTSWEGNNE